MRPTFNGSTLIGRTENFFSERRRFQNAVPASRRNVARKIQQMSLDDSACCHLKVGRMPMLVTDRRLLVSPSSRVRVMYTPVRQKLLFGAQIKRREREFAAVSGAADDFPGQHKWPSEQAARLSHIAFGNFAPNDGAGNHLAMSFLPRGG